VVPVDASALRVSVVVWFPDDEGARTVVHELAHTLGRRHAPCGVADDLDPAFPFADGRIGVVGYDARRDTMLPPETKDFMSYCAPSWISAYHYAAIYERFVAVTGPRPL
jgi:hypothetical protein